MQWRILAFLALLPLLQGDSTTTPVSSGHNDIPRQEEISREFNSDLDLDSNPEFAEKSSEETMEDFTEKASKLNTGKPIKKPDVELSKSREDAVWEANTDYNWEYNEDIILESSGQLSEEYKEINDDSRPRSSVTNTTMGSSMKMVSVEIKKPTPVP